jgi:hypothetical protein
MKFTLKLTNFSIRFFQNLLEVTSLSKLLLSRRVLGLEWNMGWFERRKSGFESPQPPGLSHTQTLKPSNSKTSAISYKCNAFVKLKNTSYIKILVHLVFTVSG